MLQIYEQLMLQIYEQLMLQLLLLFSFLTL